MFVKVTNGTTTEYTIGQLRRDHPNISFPKQIPHDMLASYDVYPYTNIKPTYDALTQQLEVGDFSQDSDGNWIRSHSVVNQDQVFAEQAIRTRRNDLLTETDYLALSDNNLTSEMSTYRQSLRDITSQDGFPYSVNWPIKP